MEDFLYISPELERQPLRPVPVLERRQVELERELAGQRLRSEQRVGGSRNSLYFSPAFAGEFCFVSWPFQPPSILPVSSVRSEIAIYFLSSMDFVSHSTIKSILRVSIFRIARRTYGCFSVGGRKLATETASTLSTNRLSILWPMECLCNLGSIW